MTDENEQIHEHPLAQVAFVLGDHPVHVVSFEGRTFDDLVRQEFDQARRDDVLVVGVRLSPTRELLALVLHLIGVRKQVRGALGPIAMGAVVGGFRLGDGIAVLPDLGSARFCFPFGDVASHRYLMRNLLEPRRYSLSAPTRALMRLYSTLVRVSPRTAYLYRAVYLRLERV